MVRLRPGAVRIGATCLAAFAVTFLQPATPRGASPDIVISQIYGGGGNSGAPYTHDYIELFNRGSAPVPLTGLSLQYASATGTGNFGANSGQLTELPNVTLQPGQYFLVQQAGGATGTPLPTADFVDATPIAMAAGAGKVALASGTGSLGCNGGSTLCSAAALARIIDLVGYGTANFFETASAPTLSNTTAAFRAAAGCTDTDNNSADFTAAAPAPRNSSGPLNVCGGPPPVPTLSIADVAVTEGNAGTTLATFTVSLSSAAPAGGVTFDVATGDGTATTTDLDYVDKALSAQVIPAGSTTYLFSVVVNGDSAVELNEAFTVSISNVAGATVGDGNATGTIVNDDFLQAAINAIQGEGLASPLSGTPVTTSGIVTGVKLNGFFIQSPLDGVDANANTSEGLFVFTSTTPAVTAGDLVTVKGTAGEFFNLTQIDSSVPASVIVNSSGHPLPDTVGLTPSILNAKGTPTQLERFEGMRMEGWLTSVSPTNQFGEIYTVLQGVKRPRREPGVEAGRPLPSDPETGLPDCCVPVWDLNPERLMVDTDGLIGSSVLWATSGVTFAAVGPLDFTFGEYKLLPVGGPQNSSANMAAVAVPAPAADEFTVAGYNIENFSGNATQKRKAALNIRTIMRSPDVIGVVEIASLAALESLASEVNANALAAGEPDPAYQAYLLDAIDNQRAGFLVKSARVLVESVTEERAGDTFIDPNTGTPATLHDRPPLVLKATVDPTGANPGRIIVVVNHLRSFIDIEDLGSEGLRVRAKRKAQAEAVAELLQELQANNPATPVIAVGDYNAYEFSDGYTDPISVLKGRPTPGDEIVVAGSPDLVTPDFVNLTDALPQAQRYSFIFEGTPQTLDHVLLNRIAHAYLQRYAIARSNADFPRHPNAGFSADPTRPEAHSDHDAPVAYFRFPGKKQP